jgi:predicted ATPase
MASFVDLAPVRDAQLVPAAIAQALGVQESGTKAVPEILGELLRDGRSLLVLDNFEHVLNAAVFVANLLAGCPGLVVVVTSREALGVRQEQVFHVEPLAVPDMRAALDLPAAAQVPSVALFEDRARARRSDFRLTGDNLRQVAEICVRLDGVPLAIELAAAQTAVFPPQAILEQLKTSTPFVLSGPRDLPFRHQTLNSAISWSYDLLEAGERAVFRWCGVFAGGFTATAVQAVRSGIEPRVETYATLAQLVTKSLVRLSDSAMDLPRYELLGTLRAFALEQLESAGELSEARRRHALYYVQLAEQIQPQLRGAGMTEALARLSREYANFREVFHWSSASGQLSLGLRLAGALYRVNGWSRRWHVTAILSLASVPLH